MTIPQTLIREWHDAVSTFNAAALPSFIAQDAVFHSPVLHTPQQGKALVVNYLTGAFHLFSNADFHYVRDIVGEENAMLEFEATIDGVHINGVDIIRWNADGQITDFKVMLRPLKAVNLVQQKMNEMLKSLASA